MIKPKTQQFQDLYQLGLLWPAWIKFFWLGFVVWLEDQYLDAVIEQDVTDAIQDWHQQEQLLNPDPQPIITESSSEVPGLPDLRIQAPWVDREVGYGRE